MKYLVVIEETPTGFSAYTPDLPGCVTTGATRREIDIDIQEAIALHLDGMRDEGLAIPLPSSWSTYVDIPAA